MKKCIPYSLLSLLVNVNIYRIKCSRHKILTLANFLVGSEKSSFLLSFFCNAFDVSLEICYCFFDFFAKLTMESHWLAKVFFSIFLFLFLLCITKVHHSSLYLFLQIFVTTKRAVHQKELREKNNRVGMERV